MKRFAYVLATLLLLLSFSGCGYKEQIAGLQEQVNALTSDNNDLNEEVSGLMQENALLESSLDEFLSATPEPTPVPQVVSLGITADELNQNIEYLIESTYTSLQPLPAPEQGTSPNGNPTLLYQLDDHITMLYTMNVLGGLQSVEVSYDFKRKSKNDEGSYGNYNALVVTAYVMALESPLEYSGTIAFKANEIISTGSYLDGSIIMTTGEYPNQLVMRLYADYN